MTREQLTRLLFRHPMVMRSRAPDPTRALSVDLAGEVEQAAKPTPMPSFPPRA